MNRRNDISDILWQYGSEEILTDEAIAKLDRIYGVLPDDGEVATNEWIVDQCGDKCVQHAGLCHLYCDDTAQLVVVPVGVNRMSFRKLCEALGVELQERKDGE